MDSQESSRKANNSDSRIQMYGNCQDGVKSMVASQKIGKLTYYAAKIPDADVAKLVHHAVLACIGAGEYPSLSAIKRRGARGTGDRIRGARTKLLDSGEIVIPPEIKPPAGLVKPKYMHQNRDRKEPVPIATPKPVILPYNSPVAKDIIDGKRAAWRLRRLLRAMSNANHTRAGQEARDTGGVHHGTQADHPAGDARASTDWSAPA
jgi:hypothetical protein